MQNLINERGRPSHLKSRILDVMKDTRPRTTTDICMRLERTSSSLRSSTGEALNMMAEQGILVRDDSLNIPIWQLSPKMGDYDAVLQFYKYSEEPAE